jgi:hypothetical protein
VLEIAGRPVDELRHHVEPLVPHDNATSLRAREPHCLTVAEVLRGLGVADGDQIELRVARGGREREVTLTTVTGPEYQAELRAGELSYAPDGLPGGHPDTFEWRTLPSGSVAYAEYGPTFPPEVEELDAFARAAARADRVVLDLRRNPGGDNTSYGGLLAVLDDPRVDKSGKLWVLTSRATFSAAGNLPGDLDVQTSARFAGEPPGGAPTTYGDVAEVELPHAGVTVKIATRYHVYGRPALAVPVQLDVEPTAADFLAGRDPVLDRVLETP